MTSHKKVTRVQLIDLSENQTLPAFELKPVPS